MGALFNYINNARNDKKSKKKETRIQRWRIEKKRTLPSLSLHELQEIIRWRDGKQGKKEGKSNNKSLMRTITILYPLLL